MQALKKQANSKGKGYGKGEEDDGEDDEGEGEKDDGEDDDSEGEKDDGKDNDSGKDDTNIQKSATKQVSLPFFIIHDLGLISILEATFGCFYWAF